MAGEYHRLLLLFVDGIGLAPGESDNPFATEASPEIERLLGGPLTAEQVAERGDRILVALDACLGVAGLPQSATGQATLFTGVNAARWMGRHVTGLPGPKLRDLVEARGLLRRLVSSSRRATFANAYSQEYLGKLSNGGARPSVTTCVAQAAGVRLRTWDDLEVGRAVTWDIVGDYYGVKADSSVRKVEPRVAGKRLAAVAGDHDLTIYETFLPDLAGHGRVAMDSAEIVLRLDELLGGILGAEVSNLTVVLTSDHGNFESRAAPSHTRNPVPLLVVGPAATRFRGMTSLTEVAPRVLETLGVDVPLRAPR
jgi:hypothetical protein